MPCYTWVLVRQLFEHVHYSNGYYYACMSICMWSRSPSVSSSSAMGSMASQMPLVIEHVACFLKHSNVHVTFLSLSRNAEQVISDSSSPLTWAPTTVAYTLTLVSSLLILRFTSHCAMLQTHVRCLVFMAGAAYCCGHLSRDCESWVLALSCTYFVAWHHERLVTTKL